MLVKLHTLVSSDDGKDSEDRGSEEEFDELNIEIETEGSDNSEMPPEEKLVEGEGGNKEFREVFINPNDIAMIQGFNNEKNSLISMGIDGVPPIIVREDKEKARKIVNKGLKR